MKPTLIRTVLKRAQKRWNKVPSVAIITEKTIDTIQKNVMYFIPIIYEYKGTKR